MERTQRSRGSILTGGNIISHSKASDANICINANLVYFVKNSISEDQIQVVICRSIDDTPLTANTVRSIPHTSRL